MNLDTGLEEDWKRRLEPQTASDAELAQMAGAPQPDEEEDLPALPVNESPGVPSAQAEEPPKAASSAVDLLAQVKAGQLSKPALAAAFGPPPMPAPDDGSGNASGVDWKGLAGRLGMARGQDESTSLRNSVYGGINSVLNPHWGGREKEGQATAAAEDELRLAKSKQDMGIRGAQEADRRSELGRRTAADKLRAEMAQAGFLSREEAAKAKAKADREKSERDAEAKAVEDQRKEVELGQRGKLIDAQVRHLDRPPAVKPGKPVPVPEPVLKAGELDGVPADIRPQVAAIINLQAPVPTVTTRDPEQKKIRKILYQVKPDFDESAYNRKASGLLHITNAKDTTALPVAIHHLDLAEKAINDTPEGAQFDSPTMNRMYQSVIAGTGGEEFVGPRFGLKVAADEVAAVYGANTEGGREAIAKMFDPSASKKQRLEVIRNARQYIAGKLAGGQENIDRIDPTGSSHFSLMTPSVRAALGEGETKAPGAGPKEGDEKTLSSGATAIYRNGKWVKK